MSFKLYNGISGGNFEYEINTKGLDLTQDNEVKEIEISNLKIEKGQLKTNGLYYFNYEKNDVDSLLLKDESNRYFFTDEILFTENFVLKGDFIIRVDSNVILGIGNCLILTYLNENNEEQIVKYNICKEGNSIIVKNDKITETNLIKIEWESVNGNIYSIYKQSDIFVRLKNNMVYFFLDMQGNKFNKEDGWLVENNKNYYGMLINYDSQDNKGTTEINLDSFVSIKGKSYIFLIDNCYHVMVNNEEKTFSDSNKIFILKNIDNTITVCTDELATNVLFTLNEGEEQYFKIQANVE